MKLPAILIVACSLMASPAWAHQCVIPEADLVHMQFHFPDVTRHVMSEMELASFKANLRIVRGDSAYWYERPGFSHVKVSLFLSGCRINTGGFDRAKFNGLIHQADS